MNVTLCSSFRNATGYLATYIFQIRRLASALAERGDSLYVVWGEGDSTDNTRWYLEFINHTTHREPTGELRGILLDVTHNGPDYGHIVDAGRFKQLAGVCNRIWSQIPTDSDVVIWCESDLIFDADTMIALIDDLKQVPCVAPFVAEISTGGWYDTFAYRKDGKHFNKHEPYFEGWPTTELVQVDSAGSLLVMNAELARHLTWPEEDVVVGICEQINRLDGSIWCDCGLVINHP